jgi:hypothetical protein
MAKNRTFKFTDGNEINESVEANSFKKAVKSVQSKFDPKKTPRIFVEWMSKRGVEMTKWQTIPLGRSKKLSR